jgi:hypothetical protein
VTQGELFSTEAVVPDGFTYQAEFISQAEETELLHAIEHEEFEAFDFHGYTAKRRTVEYGLQYDFGTRRTTATRSFPEFLLPLRKRAAAFARLSSGGCAS